MIVADLLFWWYGKGWLDRMAAIVINLQTWIAYFSFGTLLKTLFSPWKQIITNPGPGAGLASIKNALLDNLVSRFVGMCVRLAVIFTALVVLVVVTVVNCVFALLWPCIPALPFALIILGAL